MISDIVTPSLPMTRAVFSDSQRVRLCIFQVNLLKLDTFVSQLKSIQFVAKTVAEPLCLAYYWVQDTANPNVFAALQAFAPGASRRTTPRRTPASSPRCGKSASRRSRSPRASRWATSARASACQSSTRVRTPRPAEARFIRCLICPPPPSPSPRTIAQARACAAPDSRPTPSSPSRSETKLSTARYLHLANGGALLCHAANRSQPTGRLGRAASDRSGPAFTRGAARRHRVPAPTVACRARGGVIRVLRGLAGGVARNGEADAEERASAALRRRRAIGPLHQAGAREGRRSGCDRDLGYRLRFGSLSLVFIAQPPGGWCRLERGRGPRDRAVGHVGYMAHPRQAGRSAPARERGRRAARAPRGKSSGRGGGFVRFPTGNSVSVTALPFGTL